MIERNAKRKPGKLRKILKKKEHWQMKIRDFFKL